MHVLLIVSWYKTKDKPYLGSFFEEQARALMKEGVKVGILCTSIDMRFRSRFKASGVPAENFVDDGLPTFYHATRSILPLSRTVNYYFHAMSASRMIRSYIREHGRPDILHAHCVFSAGIVARYCSEVFKIPYIITEHFSGLVIGNLSSIAFNRSIVKRVFYDAEKAISVSSGFAKDLANKYKLDQTVFMVIPNLVNDIFFKEAQSQKEESEIILFTNSFLTPIKNHRLLLAAFSLVLKVIPTAVLRIGGNGFLLDELKRYCDQLNISGNVKFLGALNREEVKIQLDTCDIFLSTSIYETFGVSLVEALACGKPVVCTNTRGPCDIIEDGDGLIIDRHEPESFAEGILCAIRNYNTYNARSIRDRCFRRFSSVKVTSSLLRLYSISKN
jgi:L-malate glycosyltransferase